MKMSVPKLEHTMDEMTRAEFKTPPGSVGLKMFGMKSTGKKCSMKVATSSVSYEET